LACLAPRRALKGTTARKQLVLWLNRAARVAREDPGALDTIAPYHSDVTPTLQAVIRLRDGLSAALDGDVRESLDVGLFVLRERAKRYPGGPQQFMQHLALSAHAGEAFDHLW
jgi:hypothetical protein